MKSDEIMIMSVAVDDNNDVDDNNYTTTANTNSCISTKCIEPTIPIKKITIIGILLMVGIFIVVAILFRPPDKKVHVITIPPLTYNKYTGLQAVPSDGDICFDASDPSSYKNYINQLEEFIKPYREIQFGGKVINCQEKNRTGDEICNIDNIWAYPCGNRDWGYKRGEPCVILHYSNDSSYIPVAYKSIDEFPLDIPEEVKEIALEESEDEGEFDAMLVRLHCTSVLAEDYSAQGFRSYFFPNSPNVTGYLSPMGAVQLRFIDDDDNPIPGEYNVECSLWSQEPNVREVKKVSFNIRQGKDC